MNRALASKTVLVTPPGAKLDDASATTTAIDCRGFDYLLVEVILGDTDIAMAALKLQESNDDGSSDAYADISGMVYGTSTNFAGSTSSLPSATGDNAVYAFALDLRGRKRYIDLVATAGNGSTGTYLCAVAKLFRAEAMPDSTSELGYGQVLIG